VEHLEYCRVYYTDYGLDHWPIALRYRGEIQPEAIRRTKRLYKDANWVEIRIAVGS
jgi:hypothetical protein